MEAKHIARQHFVQPFWKHGFSQLMDRMPVVDDHPVHYPVHRFRLSPRHRLAHRVTILLLSFPRLLSLLPKSLIYGPLEFILTEDNLIGAKYWRVLRTE